MKQGVLSEKEREQVRARQRMQMKMVIYKNNFSPLALYGSVDAASNHPPKKVGSLTVLASFLICKQNKSISSRL